MSYPGKIAIFVHPQKETPGIAAALGRAYPVWTGIGAIGTVLIGILVFKEPASFWRLFFIFTLIASVIGLRFGMSNEMTFRPMRRFKQELPQKECEEILTHAYRGFLSVIGNGGYPYALPINFLYADGHIWFHCALQGHKMDAIKACDKACFTVIDDPVKEENDWWYHVRSVICFGRVRVVSEDAERLAMLRKLGSKYFPEGYDMEADMVKNAPRAAMLDFLIEHMSGKRVREK